MQQQRGFTLVEIMIVVAILVILANIAIPTYQRYIQKAKYTELLTQLTPARTAIELCAQLGDLDTANPEQCWQSLSADRSSGITVTTQTKGDHVWLLSYYHDSAQSGPLQPAATHEIPTTIGDGPDAFVAAFQFDGEQLSWKQGCLGKHAASCPARNMLKSVAGE